MSARPYLLNAVSVVVLSGTSVACSSSTEVFGTPYGDPVGQGGAATTSSADAGTTSSAVSSTTATSSSSAATGSTSSTSAASTTAASTTASSASSAATSASSSASSSASTGGGAPCPHGVCEQGEKLTDACIDPCVDKVCAADPYCCNNEWDQVCVYRVASACGQQCPGSPGTPTCGELYGKTVGYSLCTETPTTCEFAINTTFGSCGSICAKSGGECVSTVNDASNQTCVKSPNAQLSPNTCTWNQAFSAICICTRGCGGGAPCPAGKTCSEGSCQ